MTWIMEKGFLGIPRAGYFLIALTGSVFAVLHGIELAGSEDAEKTWLHTVGLGGSLAALVGGLTAALTLRGR